MRSIGLFLKNINTCLYGSTRTILPWASYYDTYWLIFKIMAEPHFWVTPEIHEESLRNIMLEDKARDAFKQYCPITVLFTSIRHWYIYFLSEKKQRNDANFKIMNS